MPGFLTGPRSIVSAYTLLKENDMRLVYASVLSVAVAFALPVAMGAQDADRKVAGGGITAPGWKGVIDPGAAKKGSTINDSKFAKDGNTLVLAVGPAATYWNPANTAKGDYSVKASFKEPKPSGGHPHPAGMFIGGTKLETDQQSLMYCVAYSDGSFLVRRFIGAKVETVTPKTPHEAVNKAAADGSVTNEIGWTVKGSRAECVINGKPVVGYDKSEIVGAGKLESTDGIFGIRISHNVNIVVTGFPASGS